MHITDMKMNIIELDMSTGDSELEAWSTPKPNDAKTLDIDWSASNARRRHGCRRDHGWTAELAELRWGDGADYSLRDLAQGLSARGLPLFGFRSWSEHTSIGTHICHARLTKLKHIA